MGTLSDTGGALLPVSACEGCQLVLQTHQLREGVLKGRLLHNDWMINAQLPEVSRFSVTFSSQVLEASQF